VLGVEVLFVESIMESIDLLRNVEKLIEGLERALSNTGRR